MVSGHPHGAVRLVGRGGLAGGHGGVEWFGPGLGESHLNEGETRDRHAGQGSAGRQCFRLNPGSVAPGMRKTASRGLSPQLVT